MEKSQLQRSPIAVSQKILVLDCHDQTLTVVRSLSRAGYAVILGVTDEELRRGFVHASRFVSSSWLHPDIVDEAPGFEAAILEFLSKNPQLGMIYPVGENSVRGLGKIRDKLPPNVLVAMPENGAVEACLHKPSAYRIAQKCQVPTPGTRTVRTVEELRRSASELGLPLIAKAPDSTSLLLGRKCVFVRTEHDLAALASQWPENGVDFIVQNEITGIRHNCDVVAENGQIRMFFEYEILRTDQLDYAGNSVFDRSIQPSPVHREYCERFFDELNFSGVALVQFLRDPTTGQSYFLEANPRAGSTIALAVHCGVDLPAGALRAFIGNSAERDPGYPLNKTQNWLHGDLLGLRKARLNGEVGFSQSFSWLARAFADFIRADCHTTFVWNDPRPTMKLYWNLLTRLSAKNRLGD